MFQASRATAQHAQCYSMARTRPTPIRFDDVTGKLGAEPTEPFRSGFDSQRSKPRTKLDPDAAMHRTRRGLQCAKYLTESVQKSINAGLTHRRAIMTTAPSSTAPPAIQSQFTFGVSPSPESG